MNRSTNRWWKRLMLLLVTLSTMLVLAGCPAPEGGAGGAEPGLEGGGFEEDAGGSEETDGFEEESTGD